ncbi:bacteriophage abortive infection AbiH family protein [Clostridium perfringens]|uniref:bacteriophage abortive infection AbiH family protein n=1 Tax=Clostridium perfringens TaxID=1502 RepID=UPI00244CFBF0|nr:bacteriophage abortive infection AbiH family protein [Clostridium perfringens]MDH2473522.1 bacteriophage abortive infection AbiH family protein [Clostridium perfringens]
MKLFIIGNGFDLAHGLKTSYYDFRSYLDEENWEFLSSLESMYGLSIGGWMDHASEEIIKDVLEKVLWENFESNLSNIDETIIYDGEDIELGLEGGDIGVEDTLDDYWEDQYEFVKRLNDYLVDWVKQIDISNIFKKTNMISEFSNDKFITFNYTLVLESIYNIDKYDILHIHGSLDKNDNLPIIGHGDKEKVNEMREIAREAKEEYNEKKYSIYNAIANYCERTLKDVDEFISMNRSFFNNLNEIDEIYVIGHSLGDVDMPYFNEILRNVGDNTRWYVHYHRAEDEENYRETLINTVGVNEENITMLGSEDIFNI